MRVPRVLPSARTRPLGKESVCRVPNLRHSANSRHTAHIFFTECRLSANVRHSTYIIFAEGHWARTRQRLHMCPARATNVRWPLGRLTAVTIRRVLTFWHSAKIRTSLSACTRHSAKIVSPSAYCLALGIDPFAECQKGSTRQTCCTFLVFCVPNFLFSPQI